MTGGILAAIFLTRLMEGPLYGVAPRDAGMFSSVTVVMLAIAAPASAVPALRAVRSNPLDALRSE